MYLSFGGWRSFAFGASVSMSSKNIVSVDSHLKLDIDERQDS